MTQAYPPRATDFNDQVAVGGGGFLGNLVGFMNQQQLNRQHQTNQINELMKSGFNVKPEQQAPGLLSAFNQMFSGPQSLTDRVSMGAHHPASVAASDRASREQTQELDRASKERVQELINKSFAYTADKRSETATEDRIARGEIARLDREAQLDRDQMIQDSKRAEDILKAYERFLAHLEEEARLAAAQVEGSNMSPADEETLFRNLETITGRLNGLTGFWNELWLTEPEKKEKVEMEERYRSILTQIGSLPVLDRPRFNRLIGKLEGKNPDIAEAISDALQDQALIADPDAGNLPQTGPLQLGTPPRLEGLVEAAPTAAVAPTVQNLGDWLSSRPGSHSRKVSRFKEDLSNRFNAEGLSEGFDTNRVMEQIHRAFGVGQ
jgi:hypothetical protein